MRKMRKMTKGVNGKKKGDEFERAVVRALRAWTSRDFRRTDGSGAIKDAYTYAHELGDVRPKDPEDFPYFPFIIECKSYKKIAYHQIIAGKCLQLDEWLVQLKGDVDTFNKAVDKLKMRGLLFFKANNVEIMVATLYPYRLPDEVHKSVMIYNKKCSIFPMKALMEIPYYKGLLGKC